MKYLLRLLSYWKAVIIPPFACLVIWTLTSFSSSFLRYYPKMIEYLDITWQLKDTSGNQQILQYVYSFIYYVVDFLEILIVSLSYWLPVEPLVNLIVASIICSFGFFIVRIFVKLITLGQI